jgi:hypothetical protein
LPGYFHKNHLLLTIICVATCGRAVHYLINGNIQAGSLQCTKARHYVNPKAAISDWRPFDHSDHFDPTWRLCTYITLILHVSFYINSNFTAACPHNISSEVVLQYFGRRHVCLEDTAETGGIICSGLAPEFQSCKDHPKGSFDFMYNIL